MRNDTNMRTLGKVSFLTQLKVLIRDSMVAQDGKESACSAGDPDSIPGSGRSPGVENGNPFQNSMDRGAWWAPFHGVSKSWIQLSV